MMIRIRYGAFETNSSSTHSLIMWSRADYDEFVNGNMRLVRGRLVKSSEIAPEKIRDTESYNEYMDTYMETFFEEFTTQGGETVVAFGYYGYS